MKLCINGQHQEIGSISNLKLLLDSLHINANSVVIEHNRHVVARQLVPGVQLQEGDEIEIVQFVGGGSPEEDVPVPSPKFHV